jgi:glucokinase
MSSYALGIDLGGTFARAAVVDGGGGLVSAAKTALVDRSPAAVVEAIALAAEEASGLAQDATLEACGVGVAGQLQGDEGFISLAPNLGWRDVPFGALLTARLGRPVKVVNDLAAAAWGELVAGAGKGFSDLFVVYVGSGVGSAIIARGQPLRGARGVAGEFGHIKVQPANGRPCGCGQQGCLEAYVGGVNLLAQMRDLHQRGQAGALLALTRNDPAAFTPAVLERAASSGDPGAQGIYEPAVDYLSVAIANQITLLNPARLILGGGVLMNCPGMRERIREGIQHHSTQVSLKGFTVAEAALGDDSGIIGAAMLAI